MNSKPEGYPEPGQRRKLSAQKIDKLRKVFSKSEKTGSAIDTDTLAAGLFSKAPVDFLEKKTLAQLEDITRKSAALLGEVDVALQKLHITYEIHEGYTSFYSLIGDRPFIVNSVIECVEDFGISVSVLLHPIVLAGGYRTSLVYFETEVLSREQADLLVKQLNSSLRDLLLATDDFTSMLVRIETLAKILDNPTYRTTFTRTEKAEIADFLRWLTDGGFIFIGYAVWDVDDNEQIAGSPSTTLGIFRSQDNNRARLFEECREDCVKAAATTQPIYFSKLRTESLVNRRIRLNNIVIPEIATDGRLVAWHSIVGMLTSKALSQESSSIPLIRRKMQKLIEVEEVVHNSHDYKYIVDIIDRMPKDQALRLDIESLREIVHTIIGLQNKNDTRVSIRFDSSRRGISVLVVMPRERFNSYVRHEIQQYVETVFGAPPDSSEYHLDLSNKPLARFYFYVPVSGGDMPSIDMARFESDINDLSRTWEENLEERIISSGRFTGPRDIWFKYANAFPEEYQALQTIDDCIADIETIEQLHIDSPIHVSLTRLADASPVQDSLIVYSLGNHISISKAFPVLEHAGLEVINEKASCITPFGMEAVYVHRFLVKPKRSPFSLTAGGDANLSSGLARIFLGKAENDRLNSLILETGLSTESIALLRTYCALLWQVTGFATHGSIQEAFASAPQAALKFWEMFDIRFNPDLKIDLEARKNGFEEALSDFIDILRDITDINKDRILRGLANLLEHTLRTNFYQGGSAIALKIQSENVEVMPNPRPKFEIYVRSPAIEGVHLRGAVIARGGIRWSDRNDDFRSEILGLVKTQKIKNAVIVPNGAKGGFVLRSLPKESEQIGPAVQSGYREFIRGLLSITDNKQEDRVIHPPRVVVHDGPDPYLVVAADKGTATFSDTANEIAVKEFSFWLGDAFASGGSCGYDHKKYGITAKGAWQCVKRHFHDLGIDYATQPFTVVGIGDMSGDVFGNGMTLSAQIKLIGAFNHKHIFVDPNPDPITSFEERRRLFKLSRSQWSDYNRELISKGGGVFDRYNKEIKLSPEIREALSIGDSVPEVVSGETLIGLILKAKVDLLWNGGIGTYVKSDSETHAEVNDGTNDRVRISSNELRARVVGEGGNLGFTQQARIDIARAGGRINTDAIDNSAGVDLSDHEVNLKILFADLIKKGALTVEERDVLLTEVAHDVVESVLQHNRNHAMLLSIGIRRSSKSIEYYRSLIRLLHKSGYINRHLENLPDDDDLSDRLLKKESLFSPELAVCLAGVKMWIKDVLLTSPLCNDPRLQDFLLEYFPQTLQKRFKDGILNHALSRSIIASQVANILIDAVGITFVHRMCVTHSTNPITVIKCLLAAEIILHTKELRASLDQFDNFTQNNMFLTLRQGVGKTLRDATSWIISYHGQTLSLDEIVKLYENSYSTLVKHADEAFIGGSSSQYFERLKNYQTHKLDDFAARSLAMAPNIIPVLEMLWASKKSARNVREVATVFSQILNVLGLEPVLKAGQQIESASKWDHQLLLNSFEEIRRSISLLTCELLKKDIAAREDIEKSLKQSASYEELYNILEELKSGPLNAAALSIVGRHLRTYRLQ